MMAQKIRRTQMKTLGDLLKWEPYLGQQLRHDLLDIPCPQFIGAKEVPQHLNDITLEQLIQLEQIGAEKGVFFAIGTVLLGMTDAQTLQAPAYEMVGLRNMVVAEQERIAALFQSLSREPSADEVLAGIDKLDFGLFGLADWYAQRMHITDHDVAFKTPWVRIWQCRSNDIKEAEFEKRFQEIQISKNRR